MWNRNFNNLIASHFGITKDGYKDGGTQVKDYNGLAYSYSSNYYEYYSSSYSTRYYYYAFRNMPIYQLFAPSGTATKMSAIAAPTLMVGSGTDAENYDDYTIKEIESQGHIGYWNTVASFDSETRTWNAKLKRVLVNNSTETVKVSEVGLFTTIVNVYNNSAKIIMVQRKLLDEPITVKPGAFYSVTMDVSYVDKHDANDGTVRNFDNIIVACLRGSYTSGYADGYTALKISNGNAQTPYYNALIKFMSAAPHSLASSSGNGFVTIIGGSGDEENDYDDYKITEFSNQTYITSTANNIRYDESTHSWISTLTKVLVNNSGAPITISEIGLYAASGTSAERYCGSSYSDNPACWTPYYVLIQRKLLDDPLTVPDGAMYTISMDVRFSEQR